MWWAPQEASIATTLGASDAVSYDRFHHFIGGGAWNSAPLDVTLWQPADDLVSGEEACQIIDDTALPTKAYSSVGVDRDLSMHWRTNEITRSTEWISAAGATPHSFQYLASRCQAMRPMLGPTKDDQKRTTAIG